MANKEQLKILTQGVEVWNKWREANLNVEIDLSGANLWGAHLSYAHLSYAHLSYAHLSGAHLSYAHLSYAHLYGANLYGANLSGANLWGAHLSDAHLNGANFGDAILIDAQLSGAKFGDAQLGGAQLISANLISANLRGANLRGATLYVANLSDANLSDANLTGVQALETNFDGATFTGACIEDWKINSRTNLNNVICDCIYLKKDQQERRPSDPNRNFEPGEFAKLVEDYIETLDLIFKDGIDWQTFLTAFQELQIESESGELLIQAIERKKSGAFVIRVEVPANANKEKIEASFWSKYQPLLEAQEKEIQWLYEQKEFSIEEIKDKREEIKQQRLKNTELTTIIKTMAEKETSKYDLRYSNIGNLADQVKDNG